MQQIEGAQNKPGIYRGIMRWEYMWSIAYTMCYTAQRLHTAHSTGGSTHITHTIHTLYIAHTEAYIHMHSKGWYTQVHAPVLVC